MLFLLIGLLLIVIALVLMYVYHSDIMKDRVDNVINKKEEVSREYMYKEIGKQLEKIFPNYSFDENNTKLELSEFTYNISDEYKVSAYIDFPYTGSFGVIEITTCNKKYDLHYSYMKTLSKNELYKEEFKETVPLIIKDIQSSVHNLNKNIETFNDTKQKINKYINKDELLSTHFEYLNIPFVISLFNISNELKILLLTENDYNNFLSLNVNFSKERAISLDRMSFYSAVPNYKVVNNNNILEKIESYTNELLYDLSNFQDAFDSITKIPINGYILQEKSLKVHDDYSLEFDYVRKNNVYHFIIKPFRKTYSFRKNNLNKVESSFAGFSHLMSEIDEILNKSKEIIPFDVENTPTLTYNNLEGKLEVQKPSYKNPTEFLKHP